MDTKYDCQCGDDAKLIFPCSGSADVGEIADHASRKLTRDGAGKMSCLAGIGGGVSGMIESAKGAFRVLVIDGCPIDCARKTMERAGITEFAHLRVTDQGMKKGQSPVTDESVAIVSTLGAEMLGSR